jgi:mono/diheme cytochrome c family protein
MKTTVKSRVLVISIAGIFLASLINLAFVEIKDKKPWVVPENAKKAKNPVKADAESLKAGKAVWNKHCKSCHGNTGKGDGTKSSELDTDPGDFSTKEFHAQTDGELFYKTKEGRDDMPSFKKKITDDEDIWHVVNFMRTMGDK